MRDHGFIYRNGTFTSFDFPSAQATTKCGVNPQGDIVGTYTNESNRGHGFLATRGAEENN
jgi:hypothetical protein